MSTMTNDAIRGELEAKCPRCGKWEPIRYDYSATSWDRPGLMPYVAVEIKGRSVIHHCEPRKP